VKVNGFRIELGEIESVLLRSCREVAVVVFESALVAFVCCDADEISTAALPHYMVPNKIVRVSKLPLNFNGKVDKAKLMQSLRENKDNNSEKKEASFSSSSLLRLVELVSVVVGRDVGVDEPVRVNSIAAVRLLALLRRDLALVKQNKKSFCFVNANTASGSERVVSLEIAATAAPNVQHRPGTKTETNSLRQGMCFRLVDLFVFF
jgi:hypothetical protein